MGAYIDFDRKSNKAWTNVEYLLKFGEFISQRTLDINSVINKPRCPNCNYTYGHSIGCRNNPVDISLKAQAQ